MLVVTPSLHADPGDLDLVTAGQAGAAVGGTTVNIFQALSADGRYVLFRSASGAVVPNDGNGRTDLFVRDRQSGRTVRVNVNTAGVVGNADEDAGFASISGDGRYVVFDSTATNLVPNDTNGVSDVFLRDLQASTTLRVSVSSSGVPGNRASTSPSVSADGRYVAFTSDATNFVNNVQSGLYVHDRLTGRTRYLRGTAYGSCGWPRISGDARYVAFECSWQHPDWDFGYGKRNGYLFELETDRVYSVVRGALHDNRITDISEDGRYIAYHTQLRAVAEDTNRMWDAYVWDRQTLQVERVSLTLQDKQANLHSFRPTLSRDGRYVAFESWAGNLVPVDPNRQGADVFVRDRLLGTTERVSVGGADVTAFNAEISANGSAIVFGSSGRLLPADTSDDPSDLYARELGARLLISPASLAFGTVAVGAVSAARTVTLKTEGTGASQVSWTGLRGTNPQQFNVVRRCPVVLRPAQSCVIDVTFAPTSTGAKAATLVVSSEADGVLAIVPVTGSGG
jgi:Tol biopolymer transport system component